MFTYYYKIMEKFFTLEEVAQQLRVSKMTIYRYIKSGKLLAYKLWKELRVKESDFSSFLEKSKFIPYNQK